MDESEEIITAIQKWLEEHSFEIRLPKTNISTPAFKTLLDDFAYPAEIQSKIWHLELTAKSLNHSFFLGYAEVGLSECRLTLIVMPKEIRSYIGQVEVWLTNADEDDDSFCQIETFDYYHQSFWEDFSNIISSMAKFG